MSVTRIDPSLPLDTPKGKGSAHFLIDYSEEHHLLWVVFLDEDGSCWTFSNPEVQLRPNETMRPKRKKLDPEFIEAIAKSGCAGGI